MIVDQEKYNDLVARKIEKYNVKVSSKFFELNNTETPCSLGDRASVLYQLSQRGIQFSQEEFTIEEKQEVESFVKCLETQMNKVMSHELKPVDLSVEEIQEMLTLTAEEVESCCLSTEEVLKMMDL